MNTYKKKNYISWHYEDGTHMLLRIARDLCAFVIRYFSLAHLSATLIAPWRKDVHFRDWRGFRPLKMAQAVFENIFSRFIGMFVRLIVIGCGLVATLLAVFFAGSIIILYIFTPLVLLSGAIMLFVGHAFIGSILIALCIVVSTLSFYTYRTTHGTYHMMALQELHRLPWFERVYRRIGVSREEMIAPLLSHFDAFEKFLNQHDLNKEEFERVLEWEIDRQIQKEQAHAFWRESALKKIRPIGQQWRYGYTVRLDRFAIDLTRYDTTEYRDVHLVDHIQEMELLELILRRPLQNNALLIGDPGIGKKTLIHAMARRIREGLYDGTYLENKRILLLDLGEAISTASQVGGDIESFLRRLFHEAAYAGNVILVIENFENFVKSDSSMTHPHIGPILTHYLGLPTFHVVGITTPTQFHRVVEKQASLMKYFEIVGIHEMTPEETGRILYERFSMMEGSIGQTLFTYQALRRILDNSTRYNNHGPLPERAIDLAMEVLLYWQSHKSAPMITMRVVDEYVSTKTGIAVGAVGKEERERLLNLEEVLKQRVIGQEEAISEVANVVRKMRSGIADPKKPAGSFLFLGPTGVGKTETAKALAESYFGDEERMIRLDMSEYQGPSALEHLIGSQRSGESGILTQAAKEHPHGLLLLDEIEKAQSRVLDIFLQVLDEGMVTDGLGEKISFRNMIIIATSNAGALLIKKMVEEGRTMEHAHDEVIERIINDQIFRVEFLNRFDNIILFRPLSGQELHSVSRLLLHRSAQRIEKEHNISVVFADDVTDIVIERGYDAIFGARSIARFVGDVVDDVLSKKIIAGDIMRGQQVHINAKDLDHL